MSKIKDLTGKRFGRLVVDGIYDRKSGQIRWKCKCDCGNVIPCFKNTLIRENGILKSCGCTYLDYLKEYIGQRKGALEVIGAKQVKRSGVLIVKCDCGKTKEMKLNYFKNSEVTSCGCLYMIKGENNKNFTHGFSNTRIYGVYRDMYNRCYNKNDISYMNYGGRGIKICEEWLGEQGFMNFREWAYSNGYDENAPRGKCTIDRINVELDYSPSNCKWADNYVQMNNKRNNLYYEIDGVTKTLSEWCREYGDLCVQSVYGRIKRGMDVKTALTKPMMKRKKDMTDEEIAERKRDRLEKDRKWRAEHKEQIQASRNKWIENNPEKNKESKKKYEEKLKEMRKNK